jgi:hypothetical protein
MFMSVVWECMLLIVVLEVERVGVGVAGWLAGWESDLVRGGCEM